MNAWFQLFVHVWNFPRNVGNHVILVFFCILATCSDSDDEFSSALVLRIIYTDEGYSDWKPWRNDHVVIVYFLLCNIAQWCINWKQYGRIIMQNIGAMKIVNFMHTCTNGWNQALILTAIAPPLNVNIGYEAIHFYALVCRALEAHGTNSHHNLYVWVSDESFCKIPVFISLRSLKIKDWNLHCNSLSICNYGLIVLIATIPMSIPNTCLHVSRCSNVCILYWTWDANLH